MMPSTGSGACLRKAWSARPDDVFSRWAFASAGVGFFGVSGAPQERRSSRKRFIRIHKGNEILKFSAWRARQRWNGGEVDSDVGRKDRAEKARRARFVGTSISSAGDVANLDPL